MTIRQRAVLMTHRRRGGAPVDHARGDTAGVTLLKALLSSPLPSDAEVLIPVMTRHLEAGMRHQTTDDNH
ncbi:hypothetical protein FK535_14440 [Mycolicibacterium sp. 018/SC-01/001]|uniref:hypothetical protein n=1 Tax=Mycolicibacterium sp. 018/SC-01/001 TaxID=2592069 RepID=UPI00117EAFB2|nr:hypothetical protein [Mycolicibacterium sp. 018/SC-01/001]TRW82081.1 hypothetical protein FK535_14440 [Mycolicibacterium sp. 018/SC-01/001]